MKTFKELVFGRFFEFVFFKTGQVDGQMLQRLPC
jgi:hypothetical protein